jgi:acetyl esterase/lipase
LDLNYLTLAGGSAGGMLSFFASAKYVNLKETPPLFAHINLWGIPFNLEDPLSDNFPPTMIVHGKNDNMVPYKNSLIISEKLNDHGVYHELMTIEDEGHTPVSHFNDIALRIEQFLKKIEKAKSVE